MDILYIGLALAFFVLLVALVKACENLGGRK
jgi:hypothetical protein